MPLQETAKRGTDGIYFIQYPKRFINFDHHQ